MKWKKKGCQRRKIECAYIFHKTTGQINCVVSIVSVFAVSVVMLACVTVSGFMITGAYVEDALAASNLASALIDIEELGRTGCIRIKDKEKAYAIYKEALAINLQLDEDGRSFQKELLEGAVKVQEYIIYNVSNEDVEMTVFGEDGCMEYIHWGKVGEVYTPDDVLVETVTIYSKISFAVKGFGNQYINVEKENSVDVKRNERK